MAPSTISPAEIREVRRHFENTVDFTIAGYYVGMFKDACHCADPTGPLVMSYLQGCMQKIRDVVTDRAEGSDVPEMWSCLTDGRFWHLEGFADALQLTPDVKIVPHDEVPAPKTTTLRENLVGTWIRIASVVRQTEASEAASLVERASTESLPPEISPGTPSETPAPVPTPDPSVSDVEEVSQISGTLEETQTPPPPVPPQS